MRKLKVKVRKLDNGSFYVKYWWRWWEDTHKKYCATLKDLQNFLSELAEKTMWGS